MKYKIEKFKTELAEIEKELNSPDVFSDVEKMKTLTKKRNELQKIIEKHEEFFTYQNQFIENEKLATTGEDEAIAEMAREENQGLIKKIKKSEEELNEILMPKDPKDEKDVLVEIRAGAGGDEAGLFAGDLFRMYSRYAEKNGWKVGINNSSQGDLGGFKEVVFEITGSDVYSKMKHESGVHRVQRVPETEKQGRTHTSTATVAVLPKAEEKDFIIKNEDLRIDTFAASGPGGQSVNTTNSAVRITHIPTGVISSCQDQKSQHQNKDKAMDMLRSRLLAKEEEEQRQKDSDARKGQIGNGDRSEKIRTYNFPQDRITDHRIKQSWSNMDAILDGGIDAIIETLKDEEFKKRSKDDER